MHISYMTYIIYVYANTSAVFCQLYVNIYVKINVKKRSIM